jgi:hypothetical protein
MTHDTISHSFMTILGSYRFNSNIFGVHDDAPSRGDEKVIEVTLTF